MGNILYTLSNYSKIQLNLHRLIQMEPEHETI